MYTRLVGKDQQHKIVTIQYNSREGIWHGVDEDRRRTFCGQATSNNDLIPEIWEGLSYRCRICAEALIHSKIWTREDDG